MLVSRRCSTRLVDGRGRTGWALARYWAEQSTAGKFYAEDAATLQARQSFGVVRAQKPREAAAAAAASNPNASLEAYGAADGSWCAAGGQLVVSWW